MNITSMTSQTAAHLAARQLGQKMVHQVVAAEAAEHEREDLRGDHDA